MSTVRSFEPGGNNSRDIIDYLPDYGAFSRIMHNWLCGMPSSPDVSYSQVRKAMVTKTREVQHLLETPPAQSKKGRLFQSLADFFGFRQICLELAFLILVGKFKKEKEKEIEEIESYLNESIYALIQETIDQIRKTISDRNLKRKYAIIRLRGAVSVARRITETQEQPEWAMKNDYKDISPEELLIFVAEKMGIPSSERRSVSQNLMNSFKKAKLKMQKNDDAWRPKWAERPDSLRVITAPLFLKKVWADLFDKEGNIVDEERIRAYDSKLIQVVQQYISKRQERGQDLGDAEGIILTNKGWNGPARTRRSVAASPKRAVNGG